jgi:Kef-type K+ transport system membrane component KefB
MNFDNLVAVLAVAAAVPLILTAVPRVRVPGPVLEIVAGIVLGPAVLDLVQPDQAVRLVSTIGLAFLLFLAGLEIDVRHFRGPRARLAGLALGLSALLALIIGSALYAAGVVESPLLVAIILMATSLGLIIPILEDAGVADRPVGQFAIAGASLGELTPVVLLSLFFSGRTTAITSKLLLLTLLGVLVVLVVIGTLRIERSMWITRMINKLADTSAQIRIRLSMLLVVGLGALATHLGFEAILGAFIAGAILRLVDPDAERKHPLFHPKLDAIGYGFLVPVFFVTSGLTFNLSVLFSSASTGDGLAAVQRGADLGVPGPGPCGQGALRGRRGLLRRRPGFRIWWRFLQAGAVPGDGAFDRFGEVVPQVPPVGDLDGQRRALSGSFGVTAAAVPADDFHARVVIQPGTEGFRGPLGQHVDRPAGLDVYQDGAVDMPFVQREVIDAQDQRGLGVRVGGGADEPHER